MIPKLERGVHLIRQAARSIRRAPTYTAAVILSLGFALGLNTVLFSVTRRLLLDPLPFPNADQLVAVGIDQSRTRGGVPDGRPNWDVMGADIEAWSHLHSALGGAAAVSTWYQTVAGTASAEYDEGATATANLPAVLGVRPLLGRWFSAGEARSRVVVLSYALWRRQFAGDSAVVGKLLHIDGEPWTIVGVMPSGTELPLDAQYWVPFSSTQSAAAIVRVRPGVPVAAARDEMTRLSPTIYNLHRAGDAARVVVMPLGERLFGAARPELVLLSAAALVLLLIGCANITTLAIARVLARRVELSVRVALGASRRALASMIVAEHGLLAVAGWGLALALAGWLLVGARAVIPQALLHHRPLGLSWSSGAFGAVLAIASLGLLAAGPVVIAWRAGPRGLASHGARASSGREARRLHRALIIAQFALAFVLLSSAVALIHSAARLSAPDHLGFSPRGVVVTSVPLLRARYGDDAARKEFMAELTRRIRRIPAVRDIGIGPPPLVAGTETGGLHEGFSEIFLYSSSPGAAASIRRVWVKFVDPGYFSTYAIRLRDGRAFTTADDSGAPPVGIVNAVAARLFFGDADPINETIAPRALVDSGGPPITIVGEVGDVLQGAPTIATEPEVFLPLAQHGSVTPRPTIAVRVRGDIPGVLGELRRVLKSMDSHLATARLESMTSILDHALARQRFVSALLSAFAVLATVLAVIGLYAVLSYVVAQRLREFGIRRALGATEGGVLRLVFGEAVALIVSGVGLGAVLTSLTGSLLGTFLYQTTMHDPGFLLFVAVTLSVTALCAAILPGLKAIRVNPVDVLRIE
jgi:predicted permease